MILSSHNFKVKPWQSRENVFFMQVEEKEKYLKTKYVSCIIKLYASNLNVILISQKNVKRVDYSSDIE